MLLAPIGNIWCIDRESTVHAIFAVVHRHHPYPSFIDILRLKPKPAWQRPRSLPQRASGAPGYLRKPNSDRQDLLQRPEKPEARPAWRLRSSEQAVSDVEVRRRNVSALWLRERAEVVRHSRSSTVLPPRKTARVLLGLRSTALRADTRRFKRLHR